MKKIIRLLEEASVLLVLGTASLILVLLETAVEAFIGIFRKIT